MKPIRKFAFVALASSLTLSACGESDTGATAQSEAPKAEVVKTAAVTEPAKAPTPPPEPEIEAVVEFRIDDSKLKLAKEDLLMVSPVRDEANEKWSVFVQMDEAPGQKFYDLTSSSSGAALSVVVGGAIISAPKIDTPVYGGGFVFDVDNAEVASNVIAALTGQPKEVVAIDTAPPEPQEEEQAAADAETTATTAKN